MAESICQYPGCEEVATAGRFGKTYCAPHNEQVKAERQRDRPARARTGSPLTGLHGQLKDAAMMCAMGMLMAAGGSAILLDPIRGPLVVQALEYRAVKFADAWMAVARQNATVARYISQMVTGGVWLSAAGQTLAFGALAITVSGRPVIPAALLHWFPELQPLIQAPMAPVSPNGTGESHVEYGPRQEHEQQVPWPPEEA